MIERSGAQAMSAGSERRSVWASEHQLGCRDRQPSSMYEFSLMASGNSRKRARSSRGT